MLRIIRKLSLWGLTLALLAFNDAKTIQELAAPVKQFMVFEESAHYPQFEEEARFAEWLKEMTHGITNH